MNKLKKIRNRIYSAISSFMAVTFLTMSVFAEGNIANSVIATGTKKADSRCQLLAYRYSNNCYRCCMRSSVYSTWLI